MCLGLEDIHPKNFQLRFPFLRAFSTSPWLPILVFIFYRLAVGLFCLAWLIVSFFQTDGKWFLYISNWIFLSIAIYFIVGTLLSIAYSCSDEAKYLSKMKSTRWGAEPYIEGFSGDEMPARNQPHWSQEQDDRLTLPYKVFWIVFTIASVGSLQVTLIYLLIFQKNIDTTDASLVIMNSVFVTVELLISNIPVILLHFFYSHVFQSIYILFTFIYWAIGGTSEGKSYIYRALDYGEDPAWACIIVFLYLVIFQIFAHLYCYLLFTFRKWLVRNWYAKN
ncbi:uncharacterized protein LOC110245495 [Exaiptasia diaphana]|uniref:Protein rolling stone n=1 Tax=Exaiptasia diaphana TaxID=2652724 RepID=A0A913XN08_EXADI|nr:uncharacterized protein LOC110245495 [Exaiptasia diaphana]